jgi:hypothetical protein
MHSLHRLQSLPAQLNGLVRPMRNMCRTELAHDVCLSLLKSRRGAVASASAGAQCPTRVCVEVWEILKEGSDPRVQGAYTRLRARQQLPDLRQSSSLDVYSYNS